MSAGCNCGATWTGMRMEHCDSCHRTFSGSTAGDKHRTGEHHIFVGPKRRRCLTEDEMTDKGMERNARGIWTNGGTSYWATDGAA